MLANIPRIRGVEPLNSGIKGYEIEHIPRIRGVEPIIEKGVGKMDAYSPHTRG